MPFFLGEDFFLNPRDSGGYQQAKEKKNKETNN